ncbi:MAG: general stress protein [Patescibacteria group bacterium]|nr:general stress protein [Patescibacteria group bacterium]MDE2590696.1 general stress protein [Patescibacteria group bacterium]
MANNKKGRGWHGDGDGHKKAGRKGGLATARTHGQDFYSSIGRKGGSVSGGNFARNPQRAREAGRKGGKARGEKEEMI